MKFNNLSRILVKFRQCALSSLFFSRKPNCGVKMQMLLWFTVAVVSSYSFRTVIAYNYLESKLMNCKLTFHLAESLIKDSLNNSKNSAINSTVNFFLWKK